MRHRDSHLDIIGHDFMPSKRHRVQALEDEPRCVAGSFNIALSCSAAAITVVTAGSSFGRIGVLSEAAGLMTAKQ